MSDETEFDLNTIPVAALTAGDLRALADHLDALPEGVFITGEVVFANSEGDHITVAIRTADDPDYCEPRVALIASNDEGPDF